MKKILVIMGTTRQNRSSETVAKWAMKNLPETKNTTYELVDLRDWNLPMFDEPMPPLASQGAYTNKVGQEWLNKAKEADGFVIVTAEYNHSIPGVLKNALDYWYSGWTNHKPVSFISYGATSGGIRAVEHLRQVALELRMIPLHDEVNIPFIWAAFNEDGSIKDASKVDSLHSTITELDSWFSDKK
jgi:NAD(P)H-dependent FMN reductase